MENLMIPLFCFFAGFALGTHLVAKITVRYWKPKESTDE